MMRILTGHAEQSEVGTRPLDFGLIAGCVESEAK